jgi:hypothetical protein
MNEKEFRQIAQEELSKQIMENLNSGIIFKYINTLEERNKDLEQIEKEHKEENGRLREENKKLKKTIVINEQLYTKETKRLANIIQELLEESDK